MSSQDLNRAYSRLLAWYSPQWRVENGQAMLGTLLDQADADGRRTVPVSERVSLVAGGLHERLLAQQSPSRSNVMALSAAAALSVFYITIIWAPGADYAGTLGPFSNPSVITCAFLISAFVLTVLSQNRMARLLALAGVLVELVLGILSGSLGWLGPSWSTVILFVGLALLAVSPLRRTRSATIAAAALVALVTVAVLTPTAISLATDLGPWIPLILILAVTLIGLIVVATGLRLHAIAKEAR